MRKLLIILAPWLVWGALDTGIYAGLSAAAPDSFPASGGTDAAGPLVLLLILRAGYSYLAGYVAGRLGRANPGAVFIAVGLLFLTGVAVQATGWDLYPTWYHLVFLASIIPAAVLGANRGRGTGAA